MTVETIPSVPEVLMRYLAGRLGMAEVPGGFTVGTSSETAQVAGCVSLKNAGGVGQQQAQGAPWIKRRIALKCTASGEIEAEKIARYVEAVVNRISRCSVKDSDGNNQVIHSAQVVGGPVAMRDSDVRWSEMLYAEVMMST